MSDFPYRIITPEERDEDFAKLQELKPNKLTLTNVGTRAINYYFQRYRVKTKISKLNAIDYWKENKNKIKKNIKTLTRNRKDPNKEKANAIVIDVSRMGGILAGQFRPFTAVYIYQKFKPKKILDFSAGWGDRAVAAISQNIPYIGIDSNKSLKTPYKAMLNHFGGDVKMIFKRSEDISFPSGYDLVFTSPPYYNTEKYPHMKIHDTIEEFREKYWIPTITKAHQNLEKGGHIVLNMPDYMYKMTKPILGKARKIKMPIQNRFNSKDNTSRYEYIYYWTKN